MPCRLATSLYGSHRAGLPGLHGTSRLSGPAEIKKKENERMACPNGLGAGDGNRTRVACLEGRSSTIELHRRMMQGADTACPLRAPMVPHAATDPCTSRLFRAVKEVNNAAGLWTAPRGAGRRNRTPDLLVTNQLLCLLSYTGIFSPHTWGIVRREYAGIAQQAEQLICNQ